MIFRSEILSRIEIRRMNQEPITGFQNGLQILP